MAIRKKRAFFRKHTNPSKLYGNDRYKQQEAKKQSDKYTSASTPAKINIHWGW